MSSRTTHDYPGLGLPLRYWPQADMSRNVRPTFPIGSHPNVLGTDSVLLPMREVAMMAIMDRLTDKPEWYRKIFDEVIVSKWKAEAMAVPDEEWVNIAAAPGSGWNETRSSWRSRKNIVGVMSGEAFDYCTQELRSKAAYFQRTGLVPTLDASATVIKSDCLVKAELRDSLRQAFSRLQRDQAENPDWHPNSDEMVQDLVHPSMFPLAYGRTKVLKDEVVTVVDAIENWAGKGEVIPRPEKPIPPNPYFRTALGMPDVPSSFWSSSYQWLPSNAAFQADGSVKLTSYINNLHPTKYPEIYATVEKLIETAIPAWDHCLLEYNHYKHYGPGRKGSRFSVPQGADEENPENWSPSSADAPELADVEVDISQHSRYVDIEDEADRKWQILRTPVFREPKPFEEAEYDPYKSIEETEALKRLHWQSSEDGSPVRQKLMGGLRTKFKELGLQVIVKMASIELTPNKPEFPAGGWHIEGLLNERICATALYYLDSENVTDNSLSFRMQTNYDQPKLQDQVGQDSYHWMECNYGTSLGSGGSCIQNYGSVHTPEGRLLAFPNVFQHRVSSFKLADPTKPGHRRFIALWLVDPHLRIISTANVPPQQQDWWTESVLGPSPDGHARAADKLPVKMVQLLNEKGVTLPQAKGKGPVLPNEMLDKVCHELDLGTVSLQEAKEERLKLMAERMAHESTAGDEWSRASYSFCEH